MHPHVPYNLPQNTTHKPNPPPHSTSVQILIHFVMISSTVFCRLENQFLLNIHTHKDYVTSCRVLQLQECCIECGGCFHLRYWNIFLCVYYIFSNIDYIITYIGYSSFLSTSKQFKYNE